MLLYSKIWRHSGGMNTYATHCSRSWIVFVNYCSDCLLSDCLQSFDICYCVCVCVQYSVPPFTPSPTECPPAGLVPNSPVLSGSYSSGISSLSRCSVSEASGTEATPSTDHALPTSTSSGSDELFRRENKTPPPYSSNPRRPVPLPHSLSIPTSADAPPIPPKPHQLRSVKPVEQLPRPRPLPRKVSQL